DVKNHEPRVTLRLGGQHGLDSPGEMFASIGFFELPSRQPLARKPDGNDVIPDTQILKNLREHGPTSDGQWHLAMRRYDVPTMKVHINCRLGIQNQDASALSINSHPEQPGCFTIRIVFPQWEHVLDVYHKPTTSLREQKGQVKRKN